MADTYISSSSIFRIWDQLADHFNAPAMSRPSCSAQRLCHRPGEQQKPWGSSGCGSEWGKFDIVGSVVGTALAAPVIEMHFPVGGDLPLGTGDRSRLPVNVKGREIVAGALFGLPADIAAQRTDEVDPVLAPA
jgi:hypothetical protein